MVSIGIELASNRCSSQRFICGIRMCHFIRQSIIYTKYKLLHKLWGYKLFTNYLRAYHINVESMEWMRLLRVEREWTKAKEVAKECVNKHVSGVTIIGWITERKCNLRLSYESKFRHLPIVWLRFYLENGPEKYKAGIVSTWATTYACTQWCWSRILTTGKQTIFNRNTHYTIRWKADRGENQSTIIPLEVLCLSKNFGCMQNIHPS